MVIAKDEHTKGTTEMGKQRATYTTPAQPQAFRLYADADGIGAGVRRFYLVGQREDGRCRLLEQCSLLTYEADAAEMAKAKVDEVRPLVNRRWMLERVETSQRLGLRYAKDACETVLKLLGAGENKVSKAFNTEADPETVKRRAEQQAAKERRIEEAAAVVAIKAKVELAAEFAAIEKGAAKVEAKVAVTKALTELEAGLREGMMRAEILKATGWPKVQPHLDRYAAERGLTVSWTRKGAGVEFKLNDPGAA